MGKPLSAAHKKAISDALKARNGGGSGKSSSERRKERRANRTDEQKGAARAKRQERRATKKGDSEPAAAKSRYADKPHRPLEAPAWPEAHKTGTSGGQHVADKAGHKPSGLNGKDSTTQGPRMTGPLQKRQGPNPQEVESVRRQQREATAQMNKVKAARAERGEMGKLEARRDGSGNARLRRIGKRAARQGDDATVDWARAGRASNSRQRGRRS